MPFHIPKIKNLTKYEIKSFKFFPSAHKILFPSFLCYKTKMQIPIN